MLSPELTEIIETEATRIGGLWHAFTYSAHPVAAAVALKTIEIYTRRDVMGHVKAVAPVFQHRLALLGDHPLVGEARGVGLIGGIELVENKKERRGFAPSRMVAQTCARLCEEEGLIVRPLAGDRIAFCPPLVITEEEVNELFDRFGRALARTQDGLAAG